MDEEFTPEYDEEAQELDRDNIRMAIRRTGLPVDETEVEKLRIAMLKTFVLREIAANVLVPEDVKEADKRALLEAIYTNTLASLLR
jgi:hypothetical protein